VYGGACQAGVHEQASTLLLMNRIVFALLLFGLASGMVHARPAIEDQKIQFLIDSIANLRDATFIRNGSEYDAKHAADHVQTKLRYAGNRVGTAEDFIALCATGSSLSGQPYRIRFADGHEVSSAQFLHERLLHFQPPSPP